MGSEDDIEATMTIRDILTNVTTVSVPFKRSGLFKVGGRATIIRLATGNLAVFSPTTLTPSVRSKITALAQDKGVAYLIAPDLEHHISLSQWHTAYPSASVIGPEGLAQKRAKSPTYAKQNVPITFEIPSIGKENFKVSEEFDSEFEIEFVDAHPNKEIVALHKPSKTVIQADMLWNLPAREQYRKVPGGAESGVLQKIANWTFGASGQALGQRRLLWWALSAKDPAGFNKSVAKIASWDFENLVGCHGDVVLGTGREVFERVFKWHLDAAKSKGP